MPRIDRRSFLALGVGAVAWACARDVDTVSPPGASPAEPKTALSLVPTGIQLAIGDLRNAFALFRGEKPFTPTDLALSLIPPSDEPFEVTADRQQITLGRGGDADHEHEGGAEVHDIFVFRHDFDRPGVWRITAELDEGKAEAAFEVLADIASPRVGKPALATKTPTTKDARGVDPICTRDPVCSMHETTIEQAIEAGKPVVITFATPEFCTSRTCGPVVDVIEDAKKSSKGDVEFVHVEVWRNSEGVGKTDGYAPAFAEWKLLTEPWTYFIDAKGTVVDRWVGPVGADELDKAIDAFAS